MLGLRSPVFDPAQARPLIFLFLSEIVSRPFLFVGHAKEQRHGTEELLFERRVLLTDVGEDGCLRELAGLACDALAPVSTRAPCRAPQRWSRKSEHGDMWRLCFMNEPEERVHKEQRA